MIRLLARLRNYLTTGGDYYWIPVPKHAVGTGTAATAAESTHDCGSQSAGEPKRG
jgi:hypothetical protein